MEFCLCLKSTAHFTWRFLHVYTPARSARCVSPHERRALHRPRVFTRLEPPNRALLRWVRAAESQHCLRCCRQNKPAVWISLFCKRSVRSPGARDTQSRVWIKKKSENMKPKHTFIKRCVLVSCFQDFF